MLNVQNFFLKGQLTRASIFLLPLRRESTSGPRRGI